MSLKKEKKNTIQTPKGMHDILPENYLYYQYIYEKAEEIASYYGFQPIQTPHLEKTDLFTSSLGNTTDIIEKQMYTLKTRGGDNLALRPEGTAAIIRSYIEHGMHTLPQPVKFWYKGSFFRHENPQKGRFREFQQFGLEILGEPNSIADTVIIKVLTLILEEIGIKPTIVHINSLGDKECQSAYRHDLFNYYRKKISQVCSDCKKRIKSNPLRVLDCKNPNCNQLKKESPQVINYLCSTCKNHLKETLESLDTNEIPYFLDNHLVRGLDYYSRTVFEIFEDKKNEQENEDHASNSAFGGGGRYDYLAKNIGKKNIPACGGALGIERLVQYMIDKKIPLKQKKSPKIFLIQLGPAAKQKSLIVLEMLRRARILVSQSISKDSLRGQLKLASKLGIPYVLIFGQKEVLENSIIIRNMESDSQETVPMEKVVEVIKNKL